MNIEIPCMSSDSKQGSSEDPVNVDDFEIEDKYKIASYDQEIVRKDYLHDIFKSEVGNRRLFWLAFNRKTFMSAIFGVTLKPVGVFLILYYLLQILFQANVFCTYQYQAIMLNSTKEDELLMCNKIWLDWVKAMREDEATATKYLTFVLGFYVGQMIKRWVDQVKAMPDLQSITNSLAGFIQLDFYSDGTVDVEKKTSALKLRKKILRYCLLSWTMCLASISSQFKVKFSTSDIYVSKGLLKKKELEALKVCLSLHLQIANLRY